jgi:hypothetical protein
MNLMWFSSLPNEGRPPLGRDGLLHKDSKETNPLWVTSFRCDLAAEENDRTLGGEARGPARIQR